MALRILYSPYTSFGIDESAIIDRLSWPGEFPLSGGIEVYQGNLRPGMFLNLFLWIPLKLSGGSPFIAAYWMAFWGWVTSLGVFALLQKLFVFKGSEKKWVFAWVLLSPWPIIFNSLWHASFTPMFGVLILWGFLKIKENPNPDFKGHLWVLAAVILCFQIGLYFLPLLGFYFLAMIRRIISWPNKKSLFLASLLGAATVGPYYFWGSNLDPIPTTHQRLVQTQTQIHPHTQLEREPKSTKSFPQKFLIELNPQNFVSFFKIAYRLMSFATGETSRFLGPGTRSVLNLLKSYPILVPIFLVSFLTSLWFCLFALWSFYFSRARLNKCLRALGQQGERAPLTTFDFFEILAFLYPFVCAAAFVFSQKGPSAHTLWIAWPLGFFVILFAWRDQFTHTVFNSRIKSLVCIGVFSTWILSSLVGHALNPRTCTLSDLWVEGLAACPRGDPEARQRAFEVLSRYRFDKNPDSFLTNSKSF